MGKVLTFEIEAGALAAVENAAIASYKYVGSGDEIEADRAAIAAMHDTIAVSYTHLDVYKRQVLYLYITYFTILSKAQL